MMNVHSTPASDSDACGMQARACWFAEEVKPHEPALRAYLQRRFPGMSEVDDVVQESFLKTFLAWQKGRLTSVRGFLFTAASNLTISFFRRKKFISAEPVNEMQGLRVLDDADVPEIVCSQEELSIVAEAIAALPGRCREVAMLRWLRGRECHEIADELGISEATVRVQLARAVKRCGDFLHDRGLP